MNGETHPAHAHASASAGVAGLHLEFRTDAEGGVRARICVGDRYQGYAGLVHGGIIATILDEAMMRCLLAHGITALTAQLQVRYKKPLPVGLKVDVRAWIRARRPPLCEMRATIMDGASIIAFARARFMDNPHAALHLAAATT
jgi:uncharacterized protein (TIGR00369 family)